MAIRIQRAKIYNPLNIAQRNETSNGLKKDGQINNSPSFRGVWKEIKGKKTLSLINWIGYVMKPSHNRLLMGATAIVSQPWFDLFNKRVDEDTRSYSTARTMAKIIAGTSVGFAVRDICLRISNNFCDPKFEKINKGGIKNFWKNHPTWLVPSDIGKLKTKQNLTNYRKAVGTYLAIVIMIGTNFLLDVPITKYLTHVINDKYMKKRKAKPDQQPLVAGGQK